MKLKEVLNRAVSISIIPSIEWNDIANENYTMKYLLIDYGFPLIFFSSIGRNIGAFFSTQAFLGYSHNLALLMVGNIIAWIIIPYVVILSCTLILNTLIPYLGINTMFIKTLTLVIYAFSPLLLVQIFIYLHPMFRLLIPLGIFIFLMYIALIFWIGIKYLYDRISMENKIKFVLMYVILFVILVFGAQHVYSSLIDSLFPGIQPYLQ